MKRARLPHLRVKFGSDRLEAHSSTTRRGGGRSLPIAFRPKSVDIGCETGEKGGKRDFLEFGTAWELGFTNSLACPVQEADVAGVP